MKIIYVKPEKLEQAWPHAAKWIAKAHLRGNCTYPLEDMKRDIAQGKKLLLRCVSGHAFCWLVLGCVANSAHRTAVVSALGGEGALGMLDAVVSFCEAYAAANGCRYVNCSGRAGWIRELAPYGWKEQSRTCGKELEL